MALISECRPLCAQTVLDTADIVRDGDVTTLIQSYPVGVLIRQTFGLSEASRPLYDFSTDVVQLPTLPAKSSGFGTGCLRPDSRSGEAFAQQFRGVFQTCKRRRRIRWPTICPAMAR